MTTIAIRNFTGKTISLQVDLASKVSELKDLITRSTSIRYLEPALSFKGHELRDHQTLLHYGLASQDVLNISPPSKVPKVPIQFEKPDGVHFTLEVNPELTIAQLKHEIAVEEKIAVHKLKFISYSEDSQDPDLFVVPEMQDLPDDDASALTKISQFPLSTSTFFVYGPPPLCPPQPTFPVVVRLHDDGRKLEVEAKLSHTLKDFKQVVQAQHNVSIANDVLILVGKEVTGDDLPLWDLGFSEGCTIHAVPFVSCNVSIIWQDAFEAMSLHPLTRLSDIRRKVQKEYSIDESLDKYWFTLDGKEHLKEWRSLWDLDIVSGTTLYLRTRTMSIKISMWRPMLPPGHGTAVDVEEDETVWGLMERWALITGYPIDNTKKLFYRGKTLQYHRTLREEGLSGGETVVCHSISLNLVPDSMDLE